MHVGETKPKDLVFVFDKKSLNEPLSEHSKLIQHLAENDPEQPGIIIHKKTISFQKKIHFFLLF